MKIFKVVKCQKTCDMFPSQWDLDLDDGKYIYVRLRSGNFTALLCEPDKREELEGYYILDFTFSGENTMDGSFEWWGNMSTERMVEITKDMLDFSECDFVKE